MAEEAAAVGVGDGDAPEAVAVDAGHSVVARQALVEERVVGGEQLDHAAVLAQECSGRRARSRSASTGAGCRRSRGTTRDRGPRSRGCAGRATGRRSWRPAPTSAGRRSSGGPGGEARPDRSVVRRSPRRAARRRGCCSTGRTKAATRGRGRRRRRHRRSRAPTRARCRRRRARIRSGTRTADWRAGNESRARCRSRRHERSTPAPRRRSKTPVRGDRT